MEIRPAELHPRLWYLLAGGLPRMEVTMKAHESIDAYDERLAPGLEEIVRVLRAAIERSLPAATSKVWHGHPVWFDGENPIVGYEARKATVSILFWNGRALGEPGLRPVGKARAAGKEFRTVADVDEAELRRCLDKARVDVFDSVGHFRALREAAKRAKSAGGEGSVSSRRGARRARNAR